MSAQDRIARLTKQLSTSEQEELCKYIQSQYCVDEEEPSKSDEIIEIITCAVYAVIACTACVDVDKIKSTSKLEKELCIDSIDIENILIELENKFNLVKITRGSEIDTVEDIIELVLSTENIGE